MHPYEHVYEYCNCARGQWTGAEGDEEGNEVEDEEMLAAAAAVEQLVSQYAQSKKHKRFTLYARRHFCSPRLYSLFFSSLCVLLFTSDTIRLRIWIRHGVRYR